MKKTLCIFMTMVLLGTTACSVDIPYDAGQKETDTDVNAQSGSSGGQILDGRWLNSDIIGKCH